MMRIFYTGCFSKIGPSFSSRVQVGKFFEITNTLENELLNIAEQAIVDIERQFISKRLIDKTVLSG